MAEKSGRIYLSIAGEKDQFKIIANVLMMGEKLFGEESPEECIKDALVRRGLDVTPENIDKVKSHFDRKVWKKRSEPAREPALAST